MVKPVMPGTRVRLRRAHAIVPGMTVLAALEQETRMAGTSSAKTRFALLPGHDEKPIIFKWENRREGLC